MSGNGRQEWRSEQEAIGYGDIATRILETQPSIRDAYEQRYGNGDGLDPGAGEEALERLFSAIDDTYRRQLTRFISGYISDPVRAEDLYQETLVRAYRHIDRFKTSKKFSTWIYTIAKNLSKNELRNRSRDPQVTFGRLTQNNDEDDRPLEWEDPLADASRDYEQREVRRAVRDVVEGLPEHHRVVFVLRELEGKKYDEIAAITGLAVGTVKSRLSRARNGFAERVEARKPDMVAEYAW